MNNCATCKFCQPAPKHPNYTDSYGWCMVDLPVWLLDHDRQPLIPKNAFRGRACKTYQQGTFDAKKEASNE